MCIDWKRSNRKKAQSKREAKAIASVLKRGKPLKRRVRSDRALPPLTAAIKIGGYSGIDEKWMRLSYLEIFTI